MNGLETRVGETVVDPAAGWTFAWLDAGAGIGRVGNGSETLVVVVEGSGADWVVTLRGRRIAVTVRSWREQVLAAAEVAAQVAGGPIEVKATLPGLVVALEVEEGSEVVEDQRLLTLEAMKMENEVRAPRDGRIAHLAVAVGQTVATGQLLVRLE